MNIFNSLGSNHTLASALRILFSFGGRNSQHKLTEYLESRYGGRAILTFKGREALQIALSSLPANGDDVAINGFTCWAVYEAVQASGHRVHYLDISENSLHFSFETFRDAVRNNPEIKVAVIQNTLGSPCDIEPIATLCKERGIILVEDLAHSIETTYASGKEAGTVGDFVILSFSQDKVIDAVSGGALIIRNQTYADLKLPRAKRVTFSQQLKDRFYPILTWKIRAAHRVGIGGILHSIFRSLKILSRPLPDAQTRDIHELPGWYCRVILQKFAALKEVAQHRRLIAEIYTKQIGASVQVSGNAKQLERSANLRFPLLLNGRDLLIQYLKQKHIFVGDIWYDAPVGPQRFLHRTDYKGQCPHAEEVAGKIMNLPTHINVTPRDAENIATAVNEWLREHSVGYSIRTISEEAVWEEYLRAMKPHSFLHSWKWGQHYEESGSKIFRVGIFRSEELVGIALLIKIGARRGTFLVCPHGPLIVESQNEEEALRLLTAHCTRIAADEKCDWIRFCPLSKRTPDNEAMYRRLGFRNAPIHMHPELSWMLDVTKPEDELLRDMRKTTRYLIKKMEKEGVEIIQSKDPADMEQFASVYAATVERQQFTPFSKNYLKTEFELFAKDDQAVFFFGKQNGTIVAAAIIIFYNGQAFYHHSGSLGSGSNVSYLLQWRVIQEAKRRGCTLYNFWGIAPDNKPNHAWTGLSRFKKGFGGFAEEYLHAQDKPLTARYFLNYIIETVRRMRRRL